MANWPDTFDNVCHFLRREYVVMLSRSRIDPRFDVACAVLILTAETRRGG